MERRDENAVLGRLIRLETLAERKASICAKLLTDPSLASAFGKAAKVHNQRVAELTKFAKRTGMEKKGGEV